MKRVQYLIEAFFAHLLLLFFRCLPAGTASNFGGGILGWMGPKMGATKTARKNLRRAMPGKTDAEYEAIVKGMWNNLGRVIAEYPHLEKLARESVQIEGRDVVEAALAAGKGAIFVGAHIGNWELYGASATVQIGKAPQLTYRAPNNPYVDGLLQRCRTLGGQIAAHPKTRETGRKLMQALKEHEYLGFLLDQKYNEGVEVPFFGLPAMTNPVAVQLAQKYDCPLIPARCERLEGAHFRITFYPPLTLKNDTGENLPVETVLGVLHMLYEEWVTQRPEQWLWLHKRWKETS